MMAVGEQTGHFAQTMQTIADVYERELDRTVQIISALIPPVIIVMIAIVVGFVVFSILSAVFEMTQSLQLRVLSELISHRNMLFRALASALILVAVSRARGQDVVVNGLRIPQRTGTSGNNIESAWLDLRQIDNGKFEAANCSRLGGSHYAHSGRSEGRRPAQDRLSDPAAPSEGADFQVLFFRLFFDDQPDQKPQLVAWDESGTQVLQSGPLGLRRRLGNIRKRDGADGRGLNHRCGSSR